MQDRKIVKQVGRRIPLLIILLLFFFAAAAEPSDVIIIGDTQLTPVVSIISGIREKLEAPVTIYSPSAIKGRLQSIAEQENSKVVIALGREAIKDALMLPSSYSVIYDLVVTPPSVIRPNTTGFYMATPVSEYVTVVRRYLPSIKRIAVLGSPDLIRSLEVTEDPQVAHYKVRNAIELIETIKKIDSADAILLLPDVAFLTASAMEEVYLFSFRRGIPILGISEKNVKQGALLALVFDPVNVGRHIGENASSAIRGVDIGRIPPSPPQKFELYVNRDTAEKMGVQLSPEFTKRAKRVFP